MKPALGARWKNLLDLRAEGILSKQLENGPSDCPSPATMHRGIDDRGKENLQGVATDHAGPAVCDLLVDSTALGLPRLTVSRVGKLRPTERAEHPRYLHEIHDNRKRECKWKLVPTHTVVPGASQTVRPAIQGLAN